MNYDNTYVRVDLDAIESNLEQVRIKTQAQIMAVIKADAYGHGAVQLARVLEDKCAFFGVSSVAEALELRQAGIRIPILILGYTPPEAFPQVVQAGIRTAIFRLSDAQELSRVACRMNRTACVHLAVDTGMSRLGFACSEKSADICACIAGLPNLKTEGLFSHFATADCADLTRAEAQRDCFDEFFQMLKDRGVRITLRHMNNSAGLINFDRQYEMVRSGIVTYGLYPSDQVPAARLPLRPALSWYSRVSMVKTLPAGREISYGGTYVTTAPTRVATVPVGYADGYCRSLSGKFYVLIRGCRAPILGRVCMDQLMVDVTDIAGVQPDDTVTLVGTDGGETITVEQIAQAAGSFNYEFICGISRRVPRIYSRGGRDIRSVHYLLDGV